jgi:hypothetical protein
MLGSTLAHTMKRVTPRVMRIEHRAHPQRALQQAAVRTTAARAAGRWNPRAPAPATQAQAALRVSQTRVRTGTAPARTRAAAAQARVQAVPAPARARTEARPARTQTRLESAAILPRQAPPGRAVRALPAQLELPARAAEAARAIRPRAEHARTSTICVTSASVLNAAHAGAVVPTCSTLPARWPATRCETACARIRVSSSAATAAPISRAASTANRRVHAAPRSSLQSDRPKSSRSCRNFETNDRHSTSRCSKVRASNGNAAQSVSNRGAA